MFCEDLLPCVFDYFASDGFVVHDHHNMFVQVNSVVDLVLPSELAFFKGVAIVLYSALTAQRPDQMG